MKRLNIIIEQHELIKSYFDKIKEGIINKSIFSDDKKIILELIDLLKNNFETEETIINQYNSLKKEEHIREHESFISFLENEVKSKNNISIETLIFIKNWEIRHKFLYDTDLLKSNKL